MANLRPCRNKEGKLISYRIRIYRGRDAMGKQLKAFTTTFQVKPTWSEKSALKKAEAYAAVLEEQVKRGMISDDRRRFDEYCAYVLEQKARAGAKKTTLQGYKVMTPRIYQAIGRTYSAQGPPPRALESLLCAAGGRGSWRGEKYGLLPETGRLPPRKENDTKGAVRAFRCAHQYGLFGSQGKPGAG